MAITAPIRKKGLRCPTFGDHVPSLMAPIIGLTTNPVTGPASQSKGNSASSAPKYLYIALHITLLKSKAKLHPKESKIHGQNLPKIKPLFFHYSLLKLLDTELLTLV